MTDGSDRGLRVGGVVAVVPNAPGWCRPGARGELVGWRALEDEGRSCTRCGSMDVTLWLVRFGDGEVLEVDGRLLEPADEGGRCV